MTQLTHLTFELTDRETRALLNCAAMWVSVLEDQEVPEGVSVPGEPPALMAAAFKLEMAMLEAGVER